MKLVVLLCLIGFIGCCDDYWTTYGNKCYHYFRTTLNWEAARDNCLTHSANLVGINSVGENDFVSYLTACGSTGAGPRTWIGLNDKVTEDTFTNVDGSSATAYTNWQGNDNPNNWFDEDCVETNYQGRGEWNDVDCGHRRPYVCEK